MAANTSKALVSRYLDLYNTGNVAIADEIIAADFVDHTHPELRPGPEDVKRMVTGFRAAFPGAPGRRRIAPSIVPVFHCSNIIERWKDSRKRAILQA